VVGEVVEAKVEEVVEAFESDELSI